MWLPGQVIFLFTGKKKQRKMAVTIDKYVGIDPSVGMLDVAKGKVDFAEFIVGKAQELPIEDESTDIISISYGIRNVVDRVEALAGVSQSIKTRMVLL